jgi:hypothetical protein
VSEEMDMQKKTTKTTIQKMIDSIKTRLDAGDVLTLGALSQEFGLDINELTNKINVFFGEEYAYGNQDALTLYRDVPENEKTIIPTIEQLKEAGKIYANLAEEVAKNYTIKESESRNYEAYCNPVKDDLVKHLNFMKSLYTKSSSALAYEAELWDELAQIVYENEEEAIAEEKNPIATEIIEHLQYLAGICGARSSKILDAADRERIEGGDIVCLKK